MMMLFACSHPENPGTVPCVLSLCRIQQRRSCKKIGACDDSSWISLSHVKLRRDSRDVSSRIKPSLVEHRVFISWQIRLADRDLISHSLIHQYCIFNRMVFTHGDNSSNLLQRTTEKQHLGILGINKRLL